MSYKDIKTSEMVTLYEYFGKSQGIERGKMAWQQSVEDGVVSGHKKVESSVYTGTVRAYPRTWLDKLAAMDTALHSDYKSDAEVVASLVEAFEANRDTTSES